MDTLIQSFAICTLLVFLVKPLFIDKGDFRECVYFSGIFVLIIAHFAAYIYINYF